jgi:two-component system NtrC family sensor kinase
MRASKNGVGSRVLLPIFVLVIGLTVALLLLVARITQKVREDYHRFTVTAAAAQVSAILELAASELTTARLLDNDVVVDAKMRGVRQAIEGFWKESGLGGVIAAGGRALYSSLGPGPTGAVLAHSGESYYTVADGASGLHCLEKRFPLWGWTVTTVASAGGDSSLRMEMVLLLPLLGLGAMGLISGLFVVLWLNLRRPVSGMVAAVAAGRPMPPTGIGEFDQIGAAVNDALQDVQAKEAHIRMLLTSTAEGIYGVDTSGVCTFCNPSCVKMLGFERDEELLGKNIHELVHHTRPDGSPYPERECHILLAYQRGKGVHIDDEVFWRKDGTPFPVEYWSFPVVEGGVVTGAVLAFIDISERRRREAFIKSILETVDEGFMVVDRARRITLANRALGVMVGAPLDQIIGRPCHEIFHGRTSPCADADEGCPLTEVFASGTPQTAEHTHRRLDGSEIKVDLRAYPLRDAAGAVGSAIMTLTNVTERTTLEQQLRQAQKMEAVGRLAGGIAHDFNNMLMAIVGYGSLGREISPSGSKPQFYFDQVLAAAEKATDLTRQILAFSRKQVIQTAPVNVNAIILGLGKIVNRLLGEDIEITMNLAGAELVALVDRAQIEQVLMNLCTNARDAMPRGGRLVIGTQAMAIDQQGVIAHGLELPGRYAMITVSDTGTGMDEPTRQRIFEPFFTTKELGKGTGLGLSIVYGIVKQHHGQISVYSEPGRGTTFRIYLPLTADAPAEAVAATAAPARGGSETVLLAEDDENVRGLAVAVLEQAGYRVLAAVDGEDAVELFRKHQNDVALCLFDVVMPRQSGKEAFEQIRALRPGARVVFMSGYAADFLGLQRGDGPGASYLPKPLLPRELLLRVRDALDA